MKKQSKAAQIRTLLAEGLSVKEIAKKLKFAEPYVAQVKWHWKKAAKQKPEKKANAKTLGEGNKPVTAMGNLKSMFGLPYVKTGDLQKSGNKPVSLKQMMLDAEALTSAPGGLKKAKKVKIEKAVGELFVQEYEKMRADEKAAQQLDWKGNDWVVEISDPVNHPEHYKVGGIETIDFIEAKQLCYNLGNVVKYITRADHKGNREQDLNKALWYLSREIDKYREF